MSASSRPSIVTITIISPIALLAMTVVHSSSAVIAISVSIPATVVSVGKAVWCCGRVSAASRSVFSWCPKSGKGVKRPRKTIESRPARKDALSRRRVGAAPIRHSVGGCATRGRAVW